MELSVSEVAQRLGIDDTRVQRMVRDGQLAGRRLGRQWLIEPEDVARLAGQNRRPGRPMAPARAWGLLDFLDGGTAPWLTPVARSQTKALLRRLAGADADRWRAALRARSDVLRCRAHPAAIKRLLIEHEGLVLAAGDQQAVLFGADLVAVDPLQQVYVRAQDWPQVATRWSVRVGVSEPNLMVRLPRKVWPFERQGRVSAAAVAADLLESGEPRAVAGGLVLLDELSVAATGPRS